MNRQLWDIRKKSLLVLFTGMWLALLILPGCSSDKSTPPTEVELYAGELEILRPSLLEYRTDTVGLTVRNGSSYDLYHATRQSNICDSRGSLAGYGSPTLYFSATSFIGSNCDSLRIPQGAFTAIFRGDSLYLERRADSTTLNIIYKFRLTK